jgi:RHS repeat-associated protein
MPGRQFNNGSYRYGFNGKENDNEVKGTGNSVDFGARIYDSRLGKMLSVDPMFHKYPDMSPYNYSLNNPIYFRDGDGNEVIDMSGNKVTVLYTPKEDGTYSADYKFAPGTSQKVQDHFMANGGRAINAAIQTPTGRNQVQKIIDSKDKIHTSIHPGKTFDKSTSPTSPKNGTTSYVTEMLVADDDGVFKDKGPYIAVNIYEGSIKESEASARDKGLVQDPSNME